MATGGSPFDDCADEQELHNWTVTNGSSLEDRLNNMDWGIQQKKANRSTEKNRKKFSAGGVAESRLTNDISPDSTPGTGRRRTNTPHTFPHVKYTTQMSVPDQAELERLRQRINFTDLDERSIGSDSQGRVTAANNQRELAAENKKPFKFLPLHVNTNKSREAPSASAPTTPSVAATAKKQSPGLGLRDAFTTSQPSNDTPRLGRGAERGLLPPREDGRGELSIDSSQVVSKLIQIREYIGKASSMRDDLVEKKDIPANVERLTHLIAHLKEQERSYLRFLQKMLARENEAGTLDSAVGSGSLPESASLNMEVRSSDASNATGRVAGRSEQKEELENLRKQHELLKKMLEQQEQLRALQGRQAALLTMQHSSQHASHTMADTVPTETTGSVSGLSITSELNDELNDLIQRFHNQLHDSQTKAAVPDNRRQAASLSREVCRSRSSQPSPPPRSAASSFLLPTPLTSLTSITLTSASAASAKLTKLQELQDKKQTMDKILQELHSLRDQTLNNNSCRSASVPLSSQHSLALGADPSSDRPSALYREPNGASAIRRDASTYHPSTHTQQPQHEDAPADKLRKLKEVHKRLNELRELVQYYEQTSDMMVDTVNENVKEEEEEEVETEEDGSMLETMFDSEQENRRPPITNIRNPQHSGNWTEMNSLTNGRGGGSTNNHADGRLNTECEINNRSAAANLRSLNIPSAIECQYNRPYNQVNDDDDDDALEDEEVRGARGRDSEGSGSSRRSSLGNDDADFAQKVHRLQTAKQKLRQLQELVAMVQSDDTDATTANEDEGLHQQPNNTRGAAAGSSSAARSPRDLTLTDKAREKLYEEKLRQQQQELQQLHEERQRLMEIQDQIQDLQWACPDLQSSVSSSTVSQQALMRKVPAATSTPAPAPAAAPKANASPAATATLKPTAQAAANASVTDNEQLWCEMRRHQILREELRQRRKHLESLMAEHQRRSGLSDSPYRLEDPEGHATAATQPLSRDERTMATWGGSTPCQLDEDCYPSELGAEEEEEEEEDDEEEDGAESSSSDDLHCYSTRKQRSYSNRKTLGSNVLKPPQQFASEASGRPSPRSRGKQQQQSHGGVSIGGARRQENLRWAAELSFQEGSGSGLASRHWQEQVGTLQRQLDFSTSMCQTLLQDQQTLSYMLQTLLTGPHNALPNNLSSPQVHLVMHQLSQCYTQLAWQQNNVERLKLVLSDLLRQQQQQLSSSSGQQPQNQGSTSRDSGSACPPLSPTSLFLPFTTSMPPSVNQALNLPPGLAGFSPFSSGFNFNPLFPSAMGEFLQSAGGQASPDNQQQQQLDPNTSEYLSFPPPLQRSPLNTVDKRPQKQNEGSSSGGHESGWLNVSQPPAPINKSPSPLPYRGANIPRPQAFDQASQESFSSMPDPADPTTVTKTFRAGRKVSAQACLASRDKTPNSKRRTRRAKGHHKNMGVESDSVSSTADFVQERAPQPHRQRDQNQSLLDKLTQEKLDSKTKTGNKPNDLSSAYAWRTPFLSNRIACTEVPGASSDFSLFEALRETIYSEVATLISQNESRPHFLIELFHELQLLNTDYLRQRALYSLQDIVTRHLTDKSAAEDQASLGPVAWAAGSQSELTPSESLATSDGDVSEKNIRVIKHHDPSKRRNDAESLDNESTLSTTSNLEPFANDDLGAGVWSGDVHCPQIDTQQLDRQIKAIMTEVIPFLKEHMDEVCSYQLLTSVRRMVLTLTQQNDESKEFVRFFHRQLGGILQDSLSKFVGRTLKDCGEDLLVEISEILFNELAFFRLMQDLDSNSSSTATIANSQARHKNHRRRSPNNNQVKREHRNNEENKSPAVEKSFSPVYLEDKDEDETEQKETERKDSRSSETSEMEDDGESLPLSISLSKAETQALTNYGSGEDENEVEEMEEFEAEPQDVQTSLQASNDGVEQRGAANEVPANGNRETKSDQESSESNDVKSSKSESIEVVDSPEEEGEGVEHRRPERESQGDAASATTNYQEGSHSQGSNSSSSPDTESPVMVNIDEVGSGNTSQKSDEEDFVKVEDLPMQLSVICEEALQKRIVEEQQNNNLSAEILNGNTDTLAGLVGNGQSA
ncbi:pericentriolar material 1 protein-like isoform X4 [Oncorhynchus tshawytscha]|uniref:Pericentriolar material 1 protein C-terminal domain-containing protein n=1 Tax=Oncorhynchus tshawytscha TaxID=74940 RepID=A0AAZ3RNE9_ONCTS|nr:pericentriolar material 1 protein-like isoform X4 [Oncorhynchus tshawytscha]